MSIQHIKASAATKLDPWGPVGIPLSEPACDISGTRRPIPGKEHADAGIWECTPGRFRREIAAGEVMHIIRGRCTFTSDGGEEVRINAGDTLFLPPQTFGIWEIHETTRKVYVLL